MCQGSHAEMRTRTAAGAAIDFAMCVEHVENEELRAAASLLCVEGLAALEAYGQRCAQFLLSALQRAASAGSSTMNEVLWMLQRFAQRNDCCKSWLLAGGGVDVIHAALLLRPGDQTLAEAGARLAYTLDGLRGLADLLCRSRGSSSREHVAVRVAVSWAVYELVRVARESGAGPRAEGGSILAVLMEAMGHESTPAEGQWACCAALDSLVKEEPRLGTLFLERGGAAMLMRALRAGGSMGQQGEDFRRAAAYLITSLSDGNQQAVNALCAEGAVQVLSEAGLQGSGMDVAASMWALGSLGGIGTVLEAMSRQGANRPAVLHGGLLALCDCAWNGAVDREELSRLPVALALLLECWAQEEASPGTFSFQECATALGSVLAALAPHVPPGRLADVDRGVEVLLKCIQATPALAASAKASSSEVAGQPSEAGGSGSQDDNSLAAEKAAEAIGRIALGAPEWRQALRTCGALEALVGWIRGSGVPRRLQKYLFWAAAAVAGLPLVINELRLQMSCVEAVDAGLCTIIDIVDDDIDDEYALAGVERCAETDVPALLGLVIECMRTHPGAPEVQSRACHCVGLLVPLVRALPAGTGAAAAAAAAPAPVAAAARRFPRRQDVVRGACAALRALFSLTPPPPQAAAGGGSSEDSSSGPFQAVALALQEEGCADCALEALDAFSCSQGAEDLLEDAAAALALGSGMETVLPKLVDAPQGSPIREGGLKGLFEVARTDLRVFRGDPAIVKAAAEVCTQLASEEPTGEEAGRVREVAALLAGLCSRVTSI